MPSRLKLIISFLLIIFSLTVKSQIHAIIQYKLITTNKNLRDHNQNYILYVNGLKSIQVSGNSLLPISNEDENNLMDIKIIKSGKPIFILKDFKSNKLSLSDHISTKQYLINDTLNLFKWKITNDYKVIQKFKCRKAVTNFRGRNYIAWFTEELPIQNGPWKFCGLPGLIINVGDDKSFFNYELTGIDLKSKFDEKIISLPKEYLNNIAMEHKNFIALINKKQADYEKLSRTYNNSAKGVSNVTISIPEKQEKF
ncbi:GLPGLI family protein [Pedobacter borealis]|uniref:GLPGLI family protein n=1 Tax=Pedobacter borealis TaxID=475254 RepID=UPI0004938833|nr:GLPGLI family protein [Pedobacter borealis]